MNISCGLLIINDNKILLGHITGKKFWDIPKGMKEEDEKYLNCCVREVREETGLDLDHVKGKFKELGLFKYTNQKSLFLYRYDMDEFPKITSLNCTSYFEFANKEFPEIDDFKYVDFNDIYKYTSDKLGLVLCKLLDIELSFEQREVIRRTMCYILRHKLKLNSKGKANPWMNIKDLYNQCIESNQLLSIFDIEDFLIVVNKDTENRFSLNGDLIKINYGHSLDILEDEFKLIKPQSILYHQTFSCFIDDIRKEGLKSMNRKHVYLATNKEKAISYNKKKNNNNFKRLYGNPKSILLEIDTKQANEDGIEFFEVTSDIVVSEYISPKYIKNLNTEGVSEEDIMNLYNNSFNVSLLRKPNIKN